MSPEDQARLESWLAADIRHVGAYARVEAVKVRLDRLKAVGADAVRRPAVGNPTPDGNVLSWSRRRIVWTGSSVLAAAAVGIVGAVLWNKPTQIADPEAEIYATSVGETRDIPLKDGSIVTLNTDSRLNVRFGPTARRIELEKGEALFRVAKDKQRPFVVKAAETEVRAVGTSFTVRLQPKRPTQIWVQEGIVEVVHRGHKATKPVRATAETQTLVADDAPIITQPVAYPKMTRNLAWQYGRIAFENETLESAAEEFSRYSMTKIIVDPAVANRTITGLFASNDPVGFAKAAASVLDLHVEVGSNEVWIIR